MAWTWRNGAIDPSLPSPTSARHGGSQGRSYQGISYQGISCCHRRSCTIRLNVSPLSVVPVSALIRKHAGGSAGLPAGLSYTWHEFSNCME